MKTISKLNSKWVPVKLDGPILSGDLEGLIGVEELTDYDFMKDSNKHQDESDDYQSDSSDNDEPTAKKNKSNALKPKKKKKQTVKKQTDDFHEIKEQNVTELSITNDAWIRLGVPDVIIKALRDQNFVSPTYIQSIAIPPALLGRKDIVGAAETGSGKTLAFGIPIIAGILESMEKAAILISSKSGTFQVIDQDDYKLKISKDSIIQSLKDKDEDLGEIANKSKMIENKKKEGNIGCVRVINNCAIKENCKSLQKPLYALILTPTRELAIQIKNHLTRAAKYTVVNIAVIVGGMAAVKQERILSKGPEIVIATPGRLWELISEGNAHLNQVDSIKYLAIDETDRMLERGHFQELHQIIERINSNEVKVQQRQTFVFSATLTLVHDIPNYLLRKKGRNSKSKISKLTPKQKLNEIIEMLRMKKPKMFDITEEKGTAGSLTECRIVCPIEDKDYYLYYFLRKHGGRTLVFCNSIGCVKRLATIFTILQCRPYPLHANMRQKQRLKNLERFCYDKNGLLIATDVAARGLDIPEIDHVIHYQVPRTSESYVHRSGRTARCQREGLTVLIMEPSEKEYYIRLCKTLGRTKDLPTFPVMIHLLNEVKRRVEIAREIDALELLCKRESSERDWIRRAEQDLDLVVDEEKQFSKTEDAEMSHAKRTLKNKTKYLTSLIAEDFFQRSFDENTCVNLNADQLVNGGHMMKAVDIMKKVIDDAPKKTKVKPLNQNLENKTVKQRMKNERRTKRKREKSQKMQSTEG